MLNTIFSLRQKDANPKNDAKMKIIKALPTVTEEEEEDGIEVEIHVLENNVPFHLDVTKEETCRKDHDNNMQCAEENTTTTTTSCELKCTIS